MHKLRSRLARGCALCGVFVVALGLMPVGPGPAQAAEQACEIADIVYLYEEEDATLEEIRDLWCPGGLINAGSCGLPRVYRMIDRDFMDEYEIAERCQGGASNQPTYQQPVPQQQIPAYAQYCITPYVTCPMAVAIPVGSPCYCPSAYGPISGLSQ